MNTAVTKQHLNQLFPSKVDTAPQYGQDVHLDAWQHFVYRMDPPDTLPSRRINDVLYSCSPETAYIVDPLLWAMRRIR